MSVILYHRYRMYLVIAFALFAISIPTALVRAVEYGGIGGRPAYPRSDNPRTQSIFVHTLNPGEKIPEGVKVLNNSATRKTLLVYAVDSEVASGGSFACKQYVEPKQDVGAWVTLVKTEVTIDSLQSELVPFSIAVPKNASVGEHNGCIIIQEKTDDDANPDQTGIVLSFRTGLRIAILVPGDIERKLEITGFSVEAKDTDFLMRPKVKNLGNVSIDANVQVRTDYFFGVELAHDGGLYPILRGQESEWNFELKKPFWGGWYKANVTVEYDPDPSAGVGTKSGKPLTVLRTQPIWFFAMPSQNALIIEAAVLLVLLWFLYLFVRSRMRKSWIKKHWVLYEVREGEDINMLAQKFGVSWKLLASANKVQAPYTLRSGQKVKVPPSASNSSTQ